jgi:hypothetical protein
MIFRTHTDEELGYFNPNSFCRDYIKYEWEVEASKHSNATARLKRLLPKCCGWLVDFGYAVIVRKKSVYKFDTNQLVEV